MNSAVKKSIAFIGRANYAEAAYLLKKTLRNNPKNLQALNLLGQVQIKQGDYAAAAEVLARSVAINAYDSEILSRLGYAYEKSDQYDEALSAYRKSLAINSDQGHVYDCLGRTYAKKRCNYDALLFFLKALEFHPQDKEIHKNIGFVSKDIGLYDLTVKHYGIASKLDPNDEKSLSCLIFNSHKDPNCDLAKLQALAETYSDKLLPKAKFNFSHKHAAKLDPKKTKLKVGFVSADLRAHPVSYYLFEVIKNMNPEQFEFYFYCNNKFEDDLTQDFKVLAAGFVCIADMEDSELAETIERTDIDVLFDMSGFTRGHRLTLFKYQAAPLQVSHIGYFGTLGMKEIDFVIADEHLVKPEDEQYFTESVYKLNPCMVHCGSYDLPQPAEQAPCQRNGYVSFGSMNSSHKISPVVIAAWSELLKRNCGARLIIDNQFLDTNSNKQFVLSTFAKHGVDSSRLELRASDSRADFLQTYHDIDIALDSFPYGGGTSTIEALKLGVPLLTIDGEKWMARQSKDILFNSGHPELVAQDLEQYLQLATELAADSSRIQNYRLTLRDDIESSEMNIEKYVLKFERAIWDMWSIKCAGG